MAPPPGPVKIGHKKDGRRRRPHRFHVSRPPPYPAAGSATVGSKKIHKKLLVISGCFIVTKLFNTVVNEFDAVKSARYSRAWLVVTELDVRGTQCSSFRDDTEPCTSTKRNASVTILAGQNEAG